MDLADKSLALASIPEHKTKSIFIATHLQLHLGDKTPGLSRQKSQVCLHAHPA
jgi:hypothetical protein